MYFFRNRSYDIWWQVYFSLRRNVEQVYVWRISHRPIGERKGKKTNIKNSTTPTWFMSDVLLNVIVVSASVLSETRAKRARRVRLSGGRFTDYDRVVPRIRFVRICNGRRRFLDLLLFVRSAETKTRSERCRRRISFSWRATWKNWKKWCRYSRISTKVRFRSTWVVSTIILHVVYFAARCKYQVFEHAGIAKRRSVITLRVQTRP